MCNKPSPPPSLESSCPNKNPTCWRLSTAVQVTVGAFMPPSRIVNAPTSYSQSKQIISKLSKTAYLSWGHHQNFRRSFYWPQEREALICLDDTACQRLESTLKNEQTLWSTHRPAPTNSLNNLQMATVANTGDQIVMFYCLSLLVFKNHSISDVNLSTPLSWWRLCIIQPPAILVYECAFLVQQSKQLSEFVIN